MGLDISHDAWHGAYSAFHRYRKEIANQIGLDLEKMEGFCSEGGIKWHLLKYRPIHDFLNHSDCEGYINWSKLSKIADDFEKILPNLVDLDGGGHIGNYHDKTKKLIEGMRLAYSNKEKLIFC